MSCDAVPDGIRAQIARCDLQARSARKFGRVDALDTSIKLTALMESK